MNIGPFRLFEKRIIKDDRPEPLVTRWILFSCPWFAVFIHKLHRSDYQRAMHDHPWTFVSIIIRGGYKEQTPMGILSHAPGDILYRPAEWKHAVIIEGKPSWNLILHGPRRRKWGFWQGDKWCWWRKYNYATDICEDEPIFHNNKD
jgi:hypothetical protein